MLLDLDYNKIAY